MAEIEFITGEIVKKCINSDELMERIELAFGDFSKGDDGGVQQPRRSRIDVDQHKGFQLSMPAYSRRENALVTKLLTFYPENKDRPTHQSLITLMDPLTGSMLALIDGVSITEYRTGLASAVATKHLANPKSKILAILGSGVQCISHFKALSLLHTFDEVRIWSRSVQSAEAAVNTLGKPCRVSLTVEEAVKDADIVCTVTFATSPILKKEWVKSGCHINAIGAATPSWQEIESELMKSAVVYVDSKEAALSESGDIIISQCEIYAEIGDVINGEKEAKWQEITIFKSLGMAVTDAVAAKMVYDKFCENRTKLNSI